MLPLCPIWLFYLGLGAGMPNCIIGTTYLVYCLLIYSPPHNFYLSFQSLLYWFFPIWFACVALIWCSYLFLHKVSLECHLWTLKMYLQQYIFGSNENIFQSLFFLCSTLVYFGSFIIPCDLGDLLYGAHFHPQLICQSLGHLCQFGVVRFQFCDNVTIRRSLHGQVV